MKSKLYETVTLTLPVYVVDYLKHESLDGRPETRLYAILGSAGLSKLAFNHKQRAERSDSEGGYHGL